MGECLYVHEYLCLYYVSKKNHADPWLQAASPISCLDDGSISAMYLQLILVRH
jgi:hypothetical protein